MNSIYKRVAFIALILLMILGLSSYIKGAVDKTGGEVRVGFYEVIFEHKDILEELIKSKKLVSQEDYYAIDDVIGSYAPFVDEHEEDNAYKLMDVYELLAETEEVEVDRWYQAEEELRQLEALLFSAGFDIE